MMRLVARRQPSLRHYAVAFAGLSPVLGTRRSRSFVTMTSAPPARGVGVGVGKLAFEATFTHVLPADPREDLGTREVKGAAFSRVRPSPPAEDDQAGIWKEALKLGQVRSGENGEPVLERALIAWSPATAALFDLDPEAMPEGAEAEEIIAVLGGFGKLWPGMEPYAACYGGHQFGSWAGQLGDGRAISLGEYVNAKGERWEMQLKGAGKTPYSRSADGRAVLRSSVREFLCSESMFHLGVPTTRALALVGTGAGVIRDMFYSGEPRMEAGNVVTRVAPSFLRLGSFQLPASRGDVDLLRKIADYAIEYHFPQFKSLSRDVDGEKPNRYTAMVAEVAKRNAEMVAKWQGIGFVHGVLNTDNISLLGLTIDYGPYGFLDAYDPEYTPNTTDIPGRRYKFGTQQDVVHWNILQFAQAMLPLCGIDDMQAVVKSFGGIYDTAYRKVMASKLGLSSLDAEEDQKLLEDLLSVMALTKADFTNAWRSLSKISSSSSPTECESVYKSVLSRTSDNASMQAWSEWMARYTTRLAADSTKGLLSKEDRVVTMNKSNPVYILRNYMAQVAIDLAEKGDYSEVHNLYQLLRNPYEVQEGMERYTYEPPSWASRKGVSVNSCSS